MKTIELTQGKVALVDDDDYELLNQHKWYAKKAKATFYAMRNIPSATTASGQETLMMHRLIMGIPAGMEIDHVNHNGLDNQKSNLRPATRGQNGCNLPRFKNNTSGYIGVSWRKDCQKWRAYIQVGDVTTSFGNFDDPREAALARDRGALRLHGEFASLNFPEFFACFDVSNLELAA